MLINNDQIFTIFYPYIVLRTHACTFSVFTAQGEL